MKKQNSKFPKKPSNNKKTKNNKKQQQQKKKKNNTKKKQKKGQVIVDNQCVSACITEIFTDGGTGKGCKILQCSRVSSCSRSHHCIRHGAFFAQNVYNIGHGGACLTSCHLDAINRFPGFIVGTLVDDRVNCNRCFSRLAVADDQLTLPTTNRNHGVYCF